MLLPFVSGAMAKTVVDGAEDLLKGAAKHTDEAADAGKALLKNTDELGDAAKGAGDGLKMSDKQFGKKVGKHAGDFGLDPSSPEARDIVKIKANEIYNNSTEIRQGEWSGLGERLPNGMRLPGQAKYYIQGNDVVVTELMGNFITIMKGGVNNSRVQAAKTIWLR